MSGGTRKREVVLECESKKEKLSQVTIDITSCFKGFWA